MNLQIKAAVEIHQFFTKADIPYAIIGGIALQHWGEPRFTRDVDVTILVDLGQEEATLKKILSIFSPRISDALEFALKHRVCLVQSREGIEIDISLGIPGYEQEVVKRAVECDLGSGIVRICSAEDLIIHKAVAGRPQDLLDIDGVIIRQGKRLNVAYIRRWLKEFSRLLEMEEILQRFEEAWRRFGKRGSVKNKYEKGSENEKDNSIPNNS
ncbi:MAG: nucleotidyl transferase AbiEii/AbiGii toxin family protein [bacterium]